MTNKERFKANIRLFEIEPHSYCNRKCWFCPNSKIDRTGPVKFLDWQVYFQILKDLASIDYNQVICFAGWCEPFSQPSFIERVREAKEYLPDAMLFANTNTDYLTTNMLQKVSEAGLTVIKAQLYFDEDEEYNELAVRDKMRKLRLRIPEIDFKEKVHLKWFAILGDMVIHAYAKDFRKVGHNRRDIQVRPATKRYHTCGEAITMFGVNHNGWAVPCCNIRSDYPPHKNMLLGKMDESPGRIFELYQGVLLPEDKYPCSICMGKQWHPNHKMVYSEIIEEMKKERGDDLNGKNGSPVNRHCKVAVGA